MLSYLTLPSFLLRLARLVGVCLLALTVVAGRAAGAEVADAKPVEASAVVDPAPEELSAEDFVVADDAPGESDDRSGESSEEEESDEGDQQAEEALQTRDSLWLACSSYELTFLSNDKGVCRCLQVDPGPAKA